MNHWHNKKHSVLDSAIGIKQKRYSWAGISVAISAAGLGLSGAQAFGAFGGKGDEYNPEDMLVYKQLPDYAEAEGARGDWWTKLQDWGKQPNYGAISPEWDEVWNLAKKKINQYYWGGIGDTGLAGKIKSSAAKRNVSQSPALENQLAMLGMSEAGQLGDLASQEAINKAQFGETSRQNWLTSLQNLAGQKPSFVTGTGAVQGSTAGTGDIISSLLSGVGGIATNLAKGKQEEDFLTKLLKGLEGQTAQSNISSNLGIANLTPSAGSTGFSGFDWNR